MPLISGKIIYNFLVFFLAFFFCLYVQSNFGQMPNLKESTSNWNEYDKNGWNKIVYNGSDGSCGLLKSNGIENTTVDYATHDFKCLDDFVAYIQKPICGHPMYNYFRECALQGFYDGKKPEESDVLKGDDHAKMRAIALLDGCFICRSVVTDNSTVKVKITVTFKQPSGSFLTSCSEETVSILDFTVNSKQLYYTFTFPLFFQPRKCGCILYTDSPQEKYENIEMKLEHNCTGGDPLLKLKLPDLKPSDFKGNVAEMRWFSLDLSNGSVNMLGIKNGIEFPEGNQMMWTNKIG